MASSYNFYNYVALLSEVMQRSGGTHDRMSFRL